MLLRRLLWLVAALLLVAAVTSALAPRDDPKPFDTTPTTTPREVATVEREIHAGTKPGPPVQARVGDHVKLAVSADELATAEIEGLDRIEPVSPTTPARFDFVASRPGRFPIVLQGNPRREVAQLEILSASAESRG